MAKIKHYLSLIVFTHTIFALPFALTGFFLAIRYDGYPLYWMTFFWILLCMVFARSAAMGFNRWADRKWDAKNPRTAGREIPKGIITSRSALIFSLINGVLFIVSAGMLNRLCFYLSPIALFVILGYSYTKRFTRWSHLILGLGLSLAPIGAYLAVAQRFALIPLLFSLVVLTWVSGFDIIYALQDTEFDRANNLNSIPSKLGKKRALGVSVLLHLVTAVTVGVIGIYGHFGILFWTGAGLFILMLIYQHRIVSPIDLSRVNRAFGTTNGIASVVFALFVILELYFH
ncbi:MAG: UbiA family prenyltransferase [Bacteroidales bacterium]|nr:UbiA family prenyltransferase [Bacteroidales bacterium]